MDPWAYSGWKNSSKTKLLASTQKKQKKKMLSLGLWVDLLGKPLSVYFFGCSRSPWTEMTTTATLRDVGGFQKSKFPFPAWLLICFLMWEDSSFGKLILLEIPSFYKKIDGFLSLLNSLFKTLPYVFRKCFSCCCEQKSILLVWMTMIVKGPVYHHSLEGTTVNA